MATAKKEVEIDHLEYVCRRLDELPAIRWTRIAADAEMSVRTLYNIRDKKVDPAYSTVKKLYDVLKAIPVEPVAAK